MKEKLNVLFLIQSGVGGAERVTINIAKMLPQDSFNTSFVVVGATHEIESFIPKDATVYFIRIKNIRFWGVLRIIRAIKRTKADIVFSSIMYINIRAIIASKICGIKVIVRNNNTIDAVSWRIRLLMKYLYKLSDRIIAQQEEMRDEIICKLDIPANKVLALHNPVDLNEIVKRSQASSPYDINKNQIKYLSVARFARNKGQDILIQAFDRVRKVKENAHLYFVGQYSEDEETYKFVKSYIEKEHLNDNVHIEGVDDNPYRWMKNCDCFVMPSRLEGLPNALIEAMQLGKPAVGTLCVPIVNRIIKEGYNGYIVNVEDVDMLADKMIKALGLKDFSATYKPSSSQDFINVFYL